MLNEVHVYMCGPAFVCAGQGGKSNFMTMIVTTPPGFIVSGRIPLRIRLVYENDVGARVVRARSCAWVCALWVARGFLSVWGMGVFVGLVCLPVASGMLTMKLTS